MPRVRSALSTSSRIPAKLQNSSLQAVLRAYIKLLHIARDACEARLILGVAVQTYVTLNDSTCRNPGISSCCVCTKYIFANGITALQCAGTSSDPKQQAARRRSSVWARSLLISKHSRTAMHAMMLLPMGHAGMQAHLPG